MNIITSFSFQIQRSTKRRTIAIRVYPDSSVKIYVPIGVSTNKINEIIKSKEKWIIAKIEQFKSRKIIEKKKEYIDGENLYYLGKQYKLKVVEAKNNSVKQEGEMILLNKNSKSEIKNILNKWLLEQAEIVFVERLKFNFAIFSRHYQYQFPTLKLRKMKSRWGSMSNYGDMTLNSLLIHVPIECIDYVIMHELCHLRYKNHSTRFYQLQSKVSPSFKELKNKLYNFQILNQICEF